MKKKIVKRNTENTLKISRKVTKLLGEKYENTFHPYYHTNIALYKLMDHALEMYKIYDDFVDIYKSHITNIINQWMRYSTRFMYFKYGYQVFISILYNGYIGNNMKIEALQLVHIANCITYYRRINKNQMNDYGYGLKADIVYYDEHVYDKPFKHYMYTKSISNNSLPMVAMPKLLSL